MPVTQPPKHKVLGEEDQQKMMERLYTQSMKSRAKRITDYNAAVDQVVKKIQHKAPSGELSEKEEKAVQHLYQQSIDRKAHTMKKLVDKFAPKPPVQKSLQDDEIQAMGERLHSQSKQHHEQMMERLTQKVYGKKGEGQRKLAKAEMEESVARQYAGALAKKKENMTKLEAEHLFTPVRKTIAADEIAAMADRLCKRESAV